MNENQATKEKVSRAPDRNLVMVIVIVLTSAFLVGYLLMGWVSGVQIDVWMWNLEDFLMEKRWNLLTGLAIIVILSSIFPIVIPKVIVFQAPGIAGNFPTRTDVLINYFKAASLLIYLRSYYIFYQSRNRLSSVFLENLMNKTLLKILAEAERAEDTDQQLAVMKYLSFLAHSMIEDD